MPPTSIRMRLVFPGVHFRGLPFILRTARRRKSMTHEINGFAIEPRSSTRHLFRRMTEPRHEYIFEITSKRIVLRATLPDDDVLVGETLWTTRNAPKKTLRRPPKSSSARLSVNGKLPPCADDSPNATRGAK